MQPFGSKVREQINTWCYHFGRELDEEAEQEIYVCLSSGSFSLWSLLKKKPSVKKVHLGWISVFQLPNYITESEFWGVGACQAGGWLRSARGAASHVGSRLGAPGPWVPRRWGCYPAPAAVFRARTTFLVSLQCSAVTLYFLSTCIIWIVLFQNSSHLPVQRGSMVRFIPSSSSQHTYKYFV